MGNEVSSSTKLKEGGIVVVTKPTVDEKETCHPELEYCPTFKPLLSTSLNIPETRPLLTELVKQIDSQSCLDLCIYFQNHLQQCSEAVKFDQAALIARIKEIDKNSSVVIQRLVDRQRAFAKHAENTRKVEEISSTLSRLRTQLERTIQLANDINSSLPSDLQLEKIELLNNVSLDFPVIEMLSALSRSFSSKGLGFVRTFSSEAQSLTLCTQENGIRRIVLNNPSKRNALSLALLESLKENLLRDIQNLDLRVIIISSTGPVFSSGHDLKELLSKKKRSDHAHIFSMCSDVMELIQDIPVPVICSVGGMAAAAGCQLVASCDIAVASEKAQFSTPGVNIGLFCSTPAVALSRSVPRKLALEMLFTGDVIDAERAVNHGLVSKVVKHEDLQDEVERIAESILQKSRSVIALGKAAFYRQVVKDRNSAYQDASNIMVENLSLHDGREGISSFLNKTKPQWDHSLD